MDTMKSPAAVCSSILRLTISRLGLKSIRDIPNGPRTHTKTLPFFGKPPHFSLPRWPLPTVHCWEAGGYVAGASCGTLRTKGSATFQPAPRDIGSGQLGEYEGGNHLSMRSIRRVQRLNSRAGRWTVEQTTSKYMEKKGRPPSLEANSAHPRGGGS